MIKTENIVRGFQNAESRWARLGPYYAIFPLDFAFEVVEKYSKEDDFIIDPFAGRGSSIYAGGVLGRHSLGIEINPVGWLFGSTKLFPADKNDVADRLLEIYSKRNYYTRAIEKLPVFYRMCYCDEVLKFLLAARNYLNWRINSVDATLISIILVYLHGKLGGALSNQMKMTKSMGMQYSIDWWKKQNLIKPPEINPAQFILDKINWRYEKGKPNVFDSRILYGDSTVEISKIIPKSVETGIKFSLLFTSPPYCSVTNYYADQWLRLWLLGGPETPKAILDKHKGRFISKDIYTNLLDTVFADCAVLMDKRSTIYVRTDNRDFTFYITLHILKKHFPKHDILINESLYTKKTQTEIFGNNSENNGEVDIILRK